MLRAPAAPPSDAARGVVFAETLAAAVAGLNSVCETGPGTPAHGMNFLQNLNQKSRVEM